VIGGGIHGVCAALALADAGMTVHLVERTVGLLQGTSAATHNRAHRGYHYPRSLRTARECAAGLLYFESKYPEALEYPERNLYAIEKDSRVAAARYEEFCRRLQLPYSVFRPEPSFLATERLEKCYLVSEPCFHLERLRQSLVRELNAAGVAQYLGCEVTRSVRRANRHRVHARRAADEIVLESDLVVNATYAATNDILELSDLAQDRVPYVFETTEVVVLRNRGAAPPAMTIMDGPFVTLLPYVGHADLLLMYDVVNSVRDRQVGWNCRPTSRSSSNWPAMRAHGKVYFPFLDSLEHVGSLWGFRPVRLHDRRDARDTKLVIHRSSPGFISIMEGKFISAPYIAAQLVSRLKRETLL